MKILIDLLAAFFCAFVGGTIASSLFDRNVMTTSYYLTFLGISGFLYVAYLLLKHRRKSA